MTAHPDPTDRQAFESLVVQHQSQVCAIAYAVLRDRARSEEVAQDAFLLAWRDRTAVAPTAGWICGIARNLARNAARRRTEAPMTDDHATHAPDARAELIAHEDAARAEAALAGLPERYRDAIVLYYRGEQSFADVALALGISEASARQRVHRGRTHLRDRLSPVEATLRATRPTAAFTAACVVAWSLAKPLPAGASSRPPAPGRPWLPPVLGAGALGLAALVAVSSGALSSSASRAGTAPLATAPGAAPRAADPRDALHARIPGHGPAHTRTGALPLGFFAVPPAAAAAAPPPSSPSARPVTVDLDFKQAPFADLAHILGDALDMPIWVALADSPRIDLTARQRPALEVLDGLLAQLHADRVEVAAIRIVPDGRTDASVLGGEPITVHFHAAPIGDVLAAIEPKLAMPIGAQFPSATLGPDGQPLPDPAPLITLELTNVPAGAVLEQALGQAHLGYELTTGLVIVPLT